MTYGSPKFFPDDWPDPKFEDWSSCKDCDCYGCCNDDCPHPCRCNYPCEAPMVTNCKEAGNG